MVHSKLSSAHYPTGHSLKLFLQVTANALSWLLFSFYHDLFFFLSSLFLSLAFFIKKISYLSQNSPLYLQTCICEALGLPSVFWQIPSADGNFSTMGNFSILSVESHQHQAISQDQWPSTPAGWQVSYQRKERDSHSLSLTFTLRHLSSLLEQGNRAMY